jgi:hypothetical protein
MTTLADEMKALALEAQRFSRKHLVLELDFSEASIQELENHADSLTFAIRGGKTPENLAMLTRIWGAYVGESLRKATGAEWVEEAAGQVRRIGLKGATVTVHPHEQVHQRLIGSKEHSILRFFQEARGQLKT